MPIHNGGRTPSEPPPVPEGPWQGRVSGARVAGREVKFRPGKILVRSNDQTALEAALARYEDYDLPFEFLVDAWWTVAVPQGQEVYWAERLRADGFRAEVNHVMFTDPGFCASRVAHPGLRIPGSLIPGSRIPGRRIPGLRIPDSRTRCSTSKRQSCRT